MFMVTWQFTKCFVSNESTNEI